MPNIEVVTIKQCLSLCCVMDNVALQSMQDIPFYVAVIRLSLPVCPGL